MSFRADEAAQRGYDKIKEHMISRRLSPSQREEASGALRQIISECGPPVDAYPTWHPLVSQNNGRYPETRPCNESGYRGLDNTSYFAHGFITCPYTNGQEVMDSAENIDCPPCVSITAERLEVPFYADGTTPILVRCCWNNGLEPNHAIPKSLAVPLMLERELPAWRWAARAETWETMRPYLLGQPHGNRSSLFVSQDTALAIKRIYMAMVDSGMFGY